MSDLDDLEGGQRYVHPPEPGCSMTLESASLWHRAYAFLPVLLVCLGLASCGGDVTGTYEDPRGFMSVEFKSAGKAYVRLPAGTVEAKYRVDGDKIIVENQGGNFVLTKNKDGSLGGGPMGMPLTKKK